MQEITTQELQKWFKEKKKFILLDCRGVDYYLWEHIPQALNLRWKYVKDRSSQVLPDKNVTIVTYCDGFTCEASLRCFSALEKVGYKNLFEYSGGLADWKAHGLKTVEDPAHKIAPNVYRFPLQSFYGETVGSYLIDEKDFILLIDGPQQLTEEHLDFVKHFEKPVKIFMSHHSTAGEVKKLQKIIGAQVHLHKADRDGPWLTVKPDVLIDDGFAFNDHLEVIHVPGHSPGSAVLYDRQNKIMFTGDHIEGTKSEQVRDFITSHGENEGDKKTRLRSTKKIFQYDFEKILPFHYYPIFTKAKQKIQRFFDTYENSHN